MLLLLLLLSQTIMPLVRCRLQNDHMTIVFTLVLIIDKSRARSEFLVLTKIKANMYLCIVYVMCMLCVCNVYVVTGIVVHSLHLLMVSVS